MNNIIVSVIVPVYNSEKYLRKCIESIISQSLSAIEVILIDDGSTDSSGKICDEYSAKNSKIKTLHVENNGVSKARNSGMEIAKGKFFSFIDADDWIDLNYFEKIVNQIQNEEADLCICGAQIHRKTKETIFIDDYCLGLEHDENGVEVLFKYFTEHNDFGGIISKLYRASLIRENRIEFNKDITRNEDILFNLEFLLNCEKICLNKEVFYHYRKHSQSKSTRYFRGDNFNLQNVYTEKKTFINNSGYDNRDLAKNLDTWQIKAISNILYKFLKFPNIIKIKEIYSEYRKVINKFRKDVKSNNILWDNISSKLKIFICISRTIGFILFPVWLFINYIINKLLISLKRKI